MLDARASTRRAYFTYDHTRWPRTFANLMRANWTPGSTIGDRTRIDVPGMSTYEAHFVGLVPPPASTKTLPRRVLLGGQEASVLSYASATTGSAASCPNMDDESTIFQFAQTPSTLRIYWRDPDGLKRWTGTPGQNPCTFGIGTWLTVSPPGLAVAEPGGLRNRLAIRPGTIDEVYFAADTAVRKTTNGGTDGWPTTLVPPITSPVLTAVHVPASGDVYVGTRGAGAWRYVAAAMPPFWERLTSVPATSCPATPCGGGFECGWDARCHPAVVSAIATTVSGGTTTVFMATSRGLFRKVGAATATVVAGGGGYWTSDVAVDCGGRVYVGFGFGDAQARHRGGIQISETGGGVGSWTSITSGVGGIHEAPVTDIEVDPYDARYVYAASYGHGYWIYDHGMPLTCP